MTATMIDTATPDEVLAPGATITAHMGDTHLQESAPDCACAEGLAAYYTGLVGVIHGYRHTGQADQVLHYRALLDDDARATVYCRVESPTQTGTWMELAATWGVGTTGDVTVTMADVEVSP